jgi:hypothetical protein
MLVGLRCLAAIVSIFAALALLAQPAGAVGPRRYVDLGRGPTHFGYQGDGWTLVFANNKRHAVRYRACVRLLTGNGAHRCWSATAAPQSRSRIFVALFVNDRGGLGRWRATWFQQGRQVGEWGFTVRSEGV